MEPESDLEDASSIRQLADPGQQVESLTTQIVINDDDSKSLQG